MRSYEAARNLFGFMALCAWAVIVIGVIVAFVGGSAASNGFRGQTELQVLLGAAPGAVVVLAGFFGLAIVQMGRASVDSAEYGQQALEVSRQQLEVSREVLAQGKTAAASYAELLKRKPAPPKPSVDTSAVSGTGSSYGDRPEQEDPVSQMNKHGEQIKLGVPASDVPAQLENAPPPTNGLTDNPGAPPREPAVNSSGKNSDV